MLVPLLLATACGQWSGAPVQDAELPPAPLGPGPLLTLAHTSGPAGEPVSASWQQTVVVAWVEEDAAERRITVFASTSDDAAKTFGAPVRVGATAAGEGAQWNVTGAAVAALSRGGRRGAPQVWVRAASGGAGSLTWHSEDGGRSFVELDAARAAAIDAAIRRDGWTHVDGTPATPGTLRIASPSSVPHAGVLEVPLPEGARGDPAALVDEHGALALAWRERDAQGATSLVVRRAWVDWEARGGAAPGFDAAYPLGRLSPRATAPAIARIPGGVVLSWIDDAEDGRATVFARRLGLDMTCTRESQAVSPADQ